jgi:phosphate-selective porin OprO and OprP
MNSRLLIIVLLFVAATMQVKAQEPTAETASKPESPALLPATVDSTTTAATQQPPQPAPAEPKAAVQPAARANEKVVPAQPAPAEPPAAPAATSEPPKTLSVGKEGIFQPGILLQGWGIVSSADKATPDRKDITTSTFRLRRAELKVKGEIIPDLVAYELMIDPARVLEFQDTTLLVQNQDPAASDAEKPESITAKQPAKVGTSTSAVAALQDFFITYKIPYADISVGQFKIPVSWEGYNSSAKLLFAERAPVAKEFGDKRDLGLRIAKTFDYVGYSAGVFNGAGQNNFDTNNSKDVGLRLEAYPVVGLILAGVAYASIGQRSQSKAKDRFEGDARFEKGPFLLQAEYIHARDVGSNNKAVYAQGFYAALAYTLIDVLQPCFRFGYLDPDTQKNLDPKTDNGKDEMWNFDFGLNWYISHHEAKLQLNYYRLQYQDKTRDNQVIAAAQVAY